MKLKIRFPGMLLPFRKHPIPGFFGNSPEDRWTARYVIILLALSLIIFQCSVCMCKAESHPLAIGEKMPDITIGNFINSPTPSIKLLDKRGKVVILEFWATWCGSCIEEMPEVARLRKAYGDRICIISVTQQSFSIVHSFLKTNQFAAGLNLQISYGDTTLSPMFPHTMVPHVVWINQAGTYLGATGQEDLTEHNIDQVLATGNTSFSELKADNLNFDRKKPLFENGNGGTPDYFYKCVLTGYQPGLPSMAGLHVEDGGVRIRATNVALDMLILRALGVSPVLFGHNRFVLEKPITDTTIFGTEGVTERSHLYCFELFSKGHNKQEGQAAMLAYLEGNFGLQAKVQTRETDCLVLRSTGYHGRLTYHGADSTDNLRDKKALFKYIRGEDISYFTAFLDQQPGILPVLNETGISTPVAMEFNAVLLNDLDLLNARLTRYGLQLKKEKRQVSMVVISLTPSDNQPNN